MNTSLYTVLTGDIVKSSRMEPAELRRLPEVLKTIFQSIDPLCEPSAFSTRFSIFRGDSFQLIVEPAIAMKAWLLIRSGLRAGFSAPLSRAVDARVGIATATVSHLAENITESSGEVFYLSGRMLEELKAPRLTGFASDNEKVNRDFNINLLLADEIVRRWTTTQSVLVPLLIQELNQDEIAQSTHTRQSTVAAKLNAMGWNAIEAWMIYFEERIKKDFSFTAI